MQDIQKNDKAWYYRPNTSDAVTVTFHSMFRKGNLLMARVVRDEDSKVVGVPMSSLRKI